MQSSNRRPISLSKKRTRRREFRYVPAFRFDFYLRLLTERIFASVLVIRLCSFGGGISSFLSGHRWPMTRAISTAPEFGHGNVGGCMGLLPIWDARQ